MKIENKLKVGLPSISKDAIDKAYKLVSDFNNAIPQLEGLGLSVNNFRMGMGIIPEIGATLIGSINSLDAGKIKGLIEKNQDNKILTAILEGMRTASNFKELIGKMVFEKVKIDVNMSLPPKIAIDFL